VEVPINDEKDGESISVPKPEVGEKRKETPKEKVENHKDAINLYGEPTKKKYNDSVATAEGRK
jgi:hypothetical protein